MSNNEDRNSFMDGHTLAAIALSMVIFLGWNFYIRAKYPPPVKPASAGGASVDTQTADSTKDKAEAVAAPRQAQPSSSPLKEQFLAYEDDKVAFEISNRGMGLRHIRLKSFKTDEGAFLDLGSDTNHRPFETTLVGIEGPVYFDMTRSTDRPGVFSGVARVGGSTIEKSIEVSPHTYSAKIVVRVQPGEATITGVRSHLTETVEPTEPGVFFLPSYHHSEFYALADGSEKRSIIDPKADASVRYDKSTLVALSSQYFTLARLDQSDVIPNTVGQFDHATALAATQVDSSWLDRSGPLETRAIAYFGPKDAGAMEAVHADLRQVINFGFFGWIARQLLQVLKFFHGVSHNWGIAIILLTLVVRIVLFPLNAAAFKSMKNMSKVAPLIKEIKDKYPDDNQKQSQEMMSLYKEHKINPLGGCLPMLLQMPIFFALYQVLASSIELYKQPFFWWIHDLSSKDPYFVLPVLMGITMFFQQKLTPSTLDPVQQRIMLVLPAVFTLLMVTLPSGLTLYIFISTLFGVIQQLILMRDSVSNSTATNTLKLGDVK